MDVYLNGQVIPDSQASISIHDRGFRFGDGVFETIPFYNGLPYQWDFHYQRLVDGLEALRIPGKPEGLKKITLELIAHNNIKQGIIRISISRGSGSQGYLPMPITPPTVLVETMAPFDTPEEPASLWLSSQQKISVKALPIEYKTAQGLSSTLARMDARDHNCFDALMLNSNRKIAETSSGSIFWLKDGMLHTPAFQCGVLRGATRHALIRLSPYPVRESVYALEALETAEAVVVCNVSLPVIAINSLLPTGYHWTSVALAQQLREVLLEDIRNECEMA